MCDCFFFYMTLSFYQEFTLEKSDVYFACGGQLREEDGYIYPIALESERRCIHTYDCYPGKIEHRAISLGSTTARDTHPSNPFSDT